MNESANPIKGVEITRSQHGDIDQEARAHLVQTAHGPIHLDLDPGHDIVVEIDIGQGLKTKHFNKLLNNYKFISKDI